MNINAAKSHCYLFVPLNRSELDYTRENNNGSDTRLTKSPTTTAYLCLLIRLGNPLVLYRSDSGM